jgi:parvulin-like peptidyl-prolyl isomerase
MGSDMTLNRSAPRWIPLFGLLVAALAAAGGCGASQNDGRPGIVNPDRPTRPETVLTVDRPSDRAVVLDGSAIPWSSLLPALAETAGAIVLEELALDRALEREITRRGLTIGETEIRAEENALLDELNEIGAGDDRMAVLDQIRRARGLGPVRYESLLRRNAALRAVVRAESAPTAEEIELARRLSFGPTLRVRLFVTASESAAEGVRTEVLAAPAEQRVWAFAERAATASAHPSAPRGGLIERFHPEDPAYPALLGGTAKAMSQGDISGVLATPAGFAVVMVEAANPARVMTEADLSRMERRVRQRKERLAMERLAQTLIARASLSPIDPSRAWSWTGRR